MSKFRNLLSHVSPAGPTPQTEPIPGEKMIENDAGGFVFEVDDWTKLDRFLILGSEGGTYYASERETTKKSTEVVARCLVADGPRVVRRIVEISEEGRAPKNDPAILALALALKVGNEPTRAAAEAAVSKVCRIGTHLFHFAEAVETFGGWGRRTRRAFARWYTEQDPATLAFGLAKYQSRDGWSHRDLLRLSKPRGHARGGDLDRVLWWATRGWPGIGAEPPAANDPTRILWAFERAKLSSSPAEVAQLVNDYGLPRECVPSESLNSPEVWDALLHAGSGMPLGALVRNLGKMGSVGLLKPMSKASRTIVKRLGDGEEIRRSRLHPIAILTALRVYAQGRGVKGSNTWIPDQQVTDALDDAFYSAFRNVEPSGRRLLIGIDWSGSMGVEVAPGLTAATIAAAVALVHASIEAETFLLAFGTNAKPVQFSPSMRLDDLARAATCQTGEGTDAAVPFEFARKNKLDVDGFVILTDNMTWAGSIHPIQSLRAFRKESGRAAVAVASAMAVNECSILPATDAGCLNVAGFDASAPAVVADFLRARS